MLSRRMSSDSKGKDKIVIVQRETMKAAAVQILCPFRELQMSRVNRVIYPFRHSSNRSSRIPAPWAVRASDEQSPLAGSEIELCWRKAYLIFSS